jgi:type II secretory ATPase GspE/PulE/Tfp pilus assembly ATPase PilB-like protein
LVLSSLHANDAASSVTRLIDIGVEPFLLASSLTCAVAQRLLRTSCTKCLEIYEPDKEMLEELELPSDKIYRRGRGCEFCSKSGYRGRVGIFEVMPITAEIRKMILSGKHASEINEFSRKLGNKSLREDARSRILDGLTTVEEVIRVTAEGK